ncbi:hypothetical protein H6F67_14055 [Microcoleus sp. FACHB-1515]|uniref:hypothetical protein n=1 Tax=Cyanophyceae TaxID=3028117 RepID=UPI0016898FCD|nr:hypothetical protein [Microcoleus sp. FACHB-1515]MBD2090975.1 hypothetical protein [Microcoleus sp. FACHB-1515]
MTRAGRVGREAIDRGAGHGDRVTQGQEMIEQLGFMEESPIANPQMGWNLDIPNEPVDPWDCRRWPNSPFCESDPPRAALPPGLFPDPPARLRPVVNRFVSVADATGFSISNAGLNNCEAWVCISPSLFGWSLPQSCLSRRWAETNCQPPDPPEASEPSAAPEPGQSLFLPNQNREGWIPGCQYFVLVSASDSGLVRPGATLAPDASRWTTHFRNDADGWVLPCYGPIVGIELQSWTIGTRRAWGFSIHCGGMGIWTEHVVPLNVQTPTPYILQQSLRTPNWSNGVANTEFGYRQHRPQSLSPAPPPYRAIWLRAYGEIPENPATTSSTRFLSRPGEILRFSIWSQIVSTWGPNPPGVPGLSFKVVRATDIAPWNGSAAWGRSCDPRPEPPPPPNTFSMPSSGCSCAEIERIIDRKLLALLGFNEARRLTFNPEDFVKAMGNQTYANFDDPKDVQVGTMPQLLAAIMATNYFRSGLQRLPATVPTQLAESNNNTTKIQDAMSWNEWEIKQMDGLLGAFPLPIKYKDSSGETKEIKLQNVSEALAEIVGIALSLNADTDVLISLGFKGVLEAIGARIAATTATDYASANAEYLGYRTKQERREVKVSVNTGTTNMKEALEETIRVVPKIKFDGKTDQQELFDRILVACEIIKSVFYRGWNMGDPLPGDRIREERGQDGNSEVDWNSFKSALENPAEGQVAPNLPKPDLRDIATPPPNPSDGSNG